ncbi:hypothetical protein NECAME_10744 [Necator americanus]|uniref:Uncharacterized protein n=1 Tax=Necator americanus TaxID=51031 RepID=W2T8A8_NECAM|nr:hypothetical protein NECAME_10744 [Necator americanus]ETN77844.1 hypothetical protein NECAME_10744 [Necator americanus]
MSPSPEPFSQRSPLPESGKNLFIQCVRPAVSQHDSLTSEPIGDVVVPVMTPVFEEEEKGIEHVRVENPQRHFERAIVGGESNSSELKRNDVVSEQKEELKESSDEISTELLIPNKPIDVESHKESTPFFRLDRISSGEESEDGRVIFVESRDLPAAFLKRHHRLKDESTSTADLEDFMTDVIRDGWSDNNANYKKEVHDKSTVTSPSLNSNSSQQQFFEKHMMQDQATSMSLSPASSPLPPLVVLEDAPETDVSLPDLKDQ